MFINTRVIPILLLKNEGLYKTVKFKDPRYVGDPINAVKIFNEKEVDELVFLDISASIDKKEPNYKMIENIASEAFMPIGYGGGVTSLSQAKRIFSIGVEKIVLNSSAYENPALIEDIAALSGVQSVVVCVDVKKNLWGKYEIYINSGKKKIKIELIDFIKECVKRGAGEIIINSIDQDGTLKGYDIGLIRSVADSVKVPIIACGGAGSIEDFRKAVVEGKASAVAAGSYFVFHGKHRAVLITYPLISDLINILP